MNKTKDNKIIILLMEMIINKNQNKILIYHLNKYNNFHLKGNNYSKRINKNKLLMLEEDFYKCLINIKTKISNFYFYKVLKLFMFIKKVQINSKTK